MDFQEQIDLNDAWLPQRGIWEGLKWMRTRPAPKPEPFEELLDRYKPLPNPLAFMERARHRQGYGAARTPDQRFMDRQTYWDWSWRNGEEDWGNASHKVIPPFRKPIYPLSQFKGRGKNAEERRCEACDDIFLAKRKDARYCGDACRKWAERNRR